MKRRRLTSYFRKHPHVAVAVVLAMGVSGLALDFFRLRAVRMDWQTTRWVETIAVSAALGIVILPIFALVLRPSLDRQDLEQGSLDTLSVVVLLTLMIPFSASHNRFGDDSIGSLFKVGLVVFSDLYFVAAVLGTFWLIRRRHEVAG
ncbi:hypothetical protein ASC61_16005 [Aeromicrobium sp. Root344]|uniref:hypothetical protein n=1 Tax=Aeromicrobium sp. Root344 TaxID=1736521 RepID=UPI0006FE2745|nr:hypothetical protein [Aeromicrobium sp. Root344]KQV76387.1 hypothetical protein ASC61_16005 [Aeromicrobium sp. Root344]